MKRFIFKDRIVSNYVLILLFALMVPLIVSVCLMQYTVQVAVTRSEENSLLQLQQTQENVDRNLVFLRRAAIKIAQNKDLLNLKEYNPASAEDVYNTFLLATDLADELDISEQCMGYYIYAFEADLVFFEGHRYSARDFFDTYIKAGQFETWKWKMQEKYFDVSRNNAGALNEMSEEGVFEYLYSYPIGSNSKGIISFIIDKNAFALESMKKQHELNATQLYVFDEAGDIIYQNGSETSEKVSKYLSFSDGCTNIKDKGKKLICKSTSNIGGLRYIFIDNGSKAFRQINLISWFTVCYALLILIVGGIYILSTARNMSRRNKEIYRVLNGRASDKDILDWNTIIDGMNELSSKSNSLELLATVKNDMVKNKLLIDLLYGKTGHVEHVKNSLKEANIDLDVEDFLLVLGTFRLPADENSELLKFAIQNILTDLLGEKYEWHFIDYNLNQIILLIQGNIDEKAMIEVNNVCDMVVEFIQNILDAEVELDASGVCHSVEELRIAAQKLLDHYEYRMLNSLEEIKEPGESIRSGGYEYLQKEENELISLVMSGLSTETEAFLEKLIKKHENSKPIVLRTLFYHLVGTLFKCAEQLGMGDITNAVEGDIITYSQNPEDIENIIKNLFSRLCESVATTEELGRINALGIKLMNYVDTNFQDPNLSLKTLSGEFGITVSYASKVFKERIGNNFSNYLTDKRIERAKQLLEESKLSISEIAQRTGYIDSSIFIKNFKKVLNMTPGQYRELKNKKM